MNNLPLDSDVWIPYNEQKVGRLIKRTHTETHFKDYSYGTQETRDWWFLNTTLHVIDENNSIWNVYSYSENQYRIDDDIFDKNTYKHLGKATEVGRTTVNIDSLIFNKSNILTSYGVVISQIGTEIDYELFDKFVTYNNNDNHYHGIMCIEGYSSDKQPIVVRDVVYFNGVLHFDNNLRLDYFLNFKGGLMYVTQDFKMQIATVLNMQKLQNLTLDEFKGALADELTNTQLDKLYSEYVYIIYLWEFVNNLTINVRAISWYGNLSEMVKSNYINKYFSTKNKLDDNQIVILYKTIVELNNKQIKELEETRATLDKNISNITHI